MMNESRYDLAVAWSWEYDEEFLNIVRKEALRQNVSLLEITRANVSEISAMISAGAIRVRWFLDRASDEDERFLPLSRDVNDGLIPGMRMFNSHSLVSFAADKATMHLEFLAHGIPVPYTIIISPYIHEREVSLSLSELSALGRSFIIKPANTTGGGLGVVMGAESLKEVLEARKGHPNDKYLLQETIRPGYLGENRAWFRVFFAFGKVFPCWWDDQTHTYEELTETDERIFSLEPLKNLALRIRSVCRLDFFSTELVLRLTGSYVAVDYVNEICDMRLQSRHPDGVADRVVEAIAAALVSSASKDSISLSSNGSAA